ncbi:hypothetical protein [Peterkaempfera sp. SMS 1(5)a]|uniref:hypothetical protein n=1 Tax=Peterkaempfera podocarpi TaxID=3232308 RepID=UPI003672EEAB
MTLSVGHPDSAAVPFLVIWGLLAVGVGGTLATRKWSTRFHTFLVSNLDGRPESQRRAARMPAGFARFIGGILAVLGVIALAASLVVILRS